MQQQLGHYQIKDLLGEGTFASVYRAFDQKFERDVALKILKPVWLSDPEAVGRFKREAKTMAKLRHPHIVDVYDVGESEGSIYLAQLLVEGETLADRLKRGPLAWPEMLDVLRALAAALDYAHGQEVIHRDIKPSNIMLDQAGRAFLGDFGLVRAAEGSMVLSTTSGGMIGTPAYMAPEQWEGKGVSPATDVYALSCVVVEMLTGKLLFDGSTPAVVMRQHLMEGPQLPGEWPEDVPQGVNDVLRRGLAENPADRFSSAGKLSAALLEPKAPPPQPETPVEIDEEVPTKPRLSREAVTLWLVSSEEQSYELKPGSLTFGRSSQCDIQLDDAQVSREHAELKFDGQRCLVYDKGSANGTFVNERQVGPEGHSFNLGDQLAIGATSFVLQTQAPVEVPAEVEQAAPAPSPPPGPPPSLPVTPPPTQRRSSTALTATFIGCGLGLLLIVIAALIILPSLFPPPTPETIVEKVVETVVVEKEDETIVETVVIEKEVEVTPEMPEEEITPETPTRPTSSGETISKVGEGDCAYGGLIGYIEAIDDLTVKFVLCSPDVAFPAKVAFTAFNIYPSEYLESTGGGGDILTVPIGTGPYQLVDWQQDNLVLKRFDDYWGEPAKTETLVFRWNSDETQRLLELQKGAVDGIDGPAPNDFMTIENDGNLALYTREGLNVAYLGMNNYHAPFDDKRVRQAIAFALDRERIVDNFYPPGSVIATQFTPCVITGGCQGTAWPAYDPEKAKALLAEAGYPDGFATTIAYRDVVRSYLPQPGLVAQEIQAQLQEVGIRADTKVMESALFIEVVFQGELQGLYLLGWGADYPDPTNFLDTHFGAKANPQFGEGFAEIHELLQAAASSVDQEVRSELYAKVNGLLVEYVPMVPIAHGSSAAAFKAGVTGAHASPLRDEYFAVMALPGQDTLVWMQRTEPASAYCADETASDTFRLCQQVSESLLTYELERTDIKPSLAEGFEVNDDLTEWIFYLRPGVKFHDGSELDAQDVLLSYEAQWNAASPLHTGREGNFYYFDSFFGVRNR